MVKSIFKIILPIILIMGVGGSAYSYIYIRNKNAKNAENLANEKDVDGWGNIKFNTNFNDGDNLFAGGRSRRKGLKRRNKSKKI